jgi:uncharacterized protein (TIGR02186 family)
MTRLAVLFLVLMLLPGLAARAEADRLVADLSADQVAIKTDFNGTSLLLFGAVAGEDGDDIVVAISGPPVTLAQRRKDRVSGIWVNREAVEWQQIPSYYHLFSNRPLDQIMPAADRKRLRIGPENLRFVRAAGKAGGGAEQAEWRAALIRNMQEAGLWDAAPSSVEVIKGALFRTNVTLPANIIPGSYGVRILHLRDGQLLNEEETSLSVAKGGFSALIYRFAHDYSIFYGLFAVFFAVAAGWLAAVAFRK